MDTSLFIALLNPAIALVLASAFCVLWLYQRRRYLAVLAVAYTGSAVGFLLQYFTLPLIGFTASRVFSCTAFTLAACCLSGAVVARYCGKVPYLGIATLACGGMLAFGWFMFVQPNLNWRVYSINFAFGGISMLVAVELRPVRNNGPTEMTLFVLSLLSGLNFFARTILAMDMHGPFTSYEGFYNSVYWTTALLSHALLSLMIALSLFTAAALDVMAELKADSHTDALSGLLNRRGFEERAARLLARCDQAKVPVALVLADLDHFKLVNDRHGHDAGDRVIADFAGKLRTASGARGVAGRIGGEEFAVLLPLTGLAAAHLFAEAIRTLCAAGRVDGLPAGVRVTASFGVAARTGNEDLAPLMRRADEALYKAKQNGRDSVRLSYQRPEVSFSAEPLSLAK